MNTSTNEPLKDIGQHRADNDLIMCFLRKLCHLAKRRAKALGMRVRYTCQRHEDGSYSLRLELAKVDGESTSTASSES